MPKASVKRLIECNKEQLIDLVLDIESYPAFINYFKLKFMKKKKKIDLISIDCRSRQLAGGHSRQLIKVM